MKTTRYILIAIVAIAVVAGAIYASHPNTAISPAQTGGQAASTTVATSTPASPAQGILPYQSGVKGRVLLDGNPYQTLVVVFRASDLVHAIVFGSTTPDGAFSFALPPGDYTVGAGESANPQCSHNAVTVGTTTYTHTTVNCGPR